MENLDSVNSTLVKFVHHNMVKGLKLMAHPSNLLEKLKIRREIAKSRMINQLWIQQEYILSHLPSADLELYRSHTSITELEHQVGRYLNIKTIAGEISRENIDGDIVEFGTWQGLGLLIFNLCFPDKMRKLIGIDSFEGLPETSTIWKKGEFSQTSLKLAFDNVQRHVADRPFELIQGWFSDPSVAQRLYQATDDVALVHFDADLASSTTQALSIIEPFLKNRTKPIYFLFDDWGCHPDEVPDAFFQWLDKAMPTYNFVPQKISSTRYTRYYKLIPSNESRPSTSTSLMA